MSTRIAKTCMIDGNDVQYLHSHGTSEGLFPLSRVVLKTGILFTMTPHQQYWDHADKKLRASEVGLGTIYYRGRFGKQVSEITVKPKPGATVNFPKVYR